MRMGLRTQHMILGTATPIQTQVRELWDLLMVLNAGANFILGDSDSPWRDWDPSVEMVTGKRDVIDPADA